MLHELLSLVGPLMCLALVAALAYECWKGRL